MTTVIETTQPLKSPINLARLDRIAPTEQEKISFLDIFFDVADEILQEMETANACGLQTQWKDAAHKLRGAAANTGMSALESLCRESENSVTPSTPPGATQLEKIRQELSRIKSFVAARSSPIQSSGI